MWGQDVEFDEIEQLPRSLDLADAQGVIEDPAGDQAWRLLWTLRRQLWRDLIRQGLLEVEFTHDEESGEGVGPILRFTTQPGAKGGTTLASTDFIDSDTMHMRYGEPGDGVFGWEEYKLINLEWQDFDSDLYEHSFRSRDRLAVIEDAVDDPGWGGLSSSVQSRVLDAVLRLHEAQMEEYEELVLDTRDVLCAIAAHPDSQPEVVSRAQSADPMVRAALSTSAP